MTGARQTIEMMQTFRQSNTKSLERWDSAYRPNREENTLYKRTDS